MAHAYPTRYGALRSFPNDYRLGLEPIGSRTHYKVWSTNSFLNDNWSEHHAGTHAGGKRAPRRTQARLTGFSDGEQTPH